MDKRQLTTDNQQFSCVIIGESTLPLQCAEIVLSHGHAVRGVISPDARLARWAAEHGIPHAVAPGDLSTLIGEQPFDYLFSIVNYQLLPSAMLAAPRRWAINYHDAPLPRYAGSYATSWALMAHEPAHAVTWHLMTEQVDAGAILLQYPIEIVADETTLTLNAKCYDAALRSFAALVADLAAERARPQAQELTARTFFARHKRPPAGCTLNWNESADVLAALVRALQFGPYPNALGLPKLALGGAFAVVTALDQPGTRSGLPPGTIVSIDLNALVVATTTADVALRGLLTIDGRPLPVAELAARYGLHMGKQLPDLDAATAARLTDLYGRLCRHEPFWVDQLADLQPIGLPYTTRSTGTPAQRESYQLALPTDVAAYLDKLPGGSRTDKLLAAFAVYLARLNGLHTFDLGFGEEALRREIGDLESFFATTVPLHVSLDMRQDFTYAAQTLIEQLALTRRHRSYARDAIARYPRLGELQRWPVVVRIGAVPPHPPSPSPTSGEGGPEEASPNASLGREEPKEANPNAFLTKGEGEPDKATPTLFTQKAVPQGPLPLSPAWERGPGGEGPPTDRWQIPHALRVKMIEVARDFRKHPTPSETLLWKALRGKQLDGRKFRRQQPIGPFVVDFFCPAERLIVEVDGPIHETQRTADQQRQRLIESLGLRFVRVTAEQVEHNLINVLDMIRAGFMPPHPPSPTSGEGEPEGPLLLSPAWESGSGAESLIFQIAPDGAACRWVYDPGALRPEQIERMAQQFLTLLDGIVTRPIQPIAELPLLPKAEHQRLLVDWNDTADHFQQDRCIHELFAAQAARTPEASAVVFGGGQPAENKEQRTDHARPQHTTHNTQYATLTYRELDQRANQLAHHLQKQGVGVETLVGVYMERSLDLVIGLLAILKAGGAYVPIDPNYPPERIAIMLEDSRAALLLTEERLAGRLVGPEARVVCMDDRLRAALAHEPSAPPVSAVASRNLAYVLFTSGSTGRPKGVAIEHRSVAALISWAGQVFADRDLAGVLFSTSICFDLSVFELFAPLSRGGTAILVENALHLPGLITPQPITLINTVPSVITELLRAGGIPPSVCTINLAGEPLPAALVSQIYQQTAVERIFDLYGPSEDTTYSTWALRRPGGPATIGRPIANTRIYLLDANRQPVPIGVPGEIYIGGAGLARGYLNRPDLTAERFIPNPFAVGENTEHRTQNDSQAICNRLYRTGDLARYLPDGTLEFLGRIDHQVKVRGFRIELDEIEAALLQHPAVREAIVLARADGGSAKRLVAYVVPSQWSMAVGPWPEPGNQELNNRQPATDNRQRTFALSNFLRQKLPEYMIPLAFVFLDALPLTPNGKVDRRALPAPGRTSAGSAGYVAPSDHVEELLATIWSQVLGVAQVGIHDNFFALGGDSIISIQIIARASQLGLRLAPRQLFQHQTIAELARVAGQTPAAHAEQGPVMGGLPLTPIQRWFFEHELPERQHWNQAMLLEVSGEVGPALLERAFERLVAHHDALRLRFEPGAGGWRQYHAAPGEPVPVGYVDLAALPEAEQSAQMAQSMAAIQASLDLVSGPLLGATLFRLGAGRPSRLLIAIHHLAIDGVSWRILLDDLQTLIVAALRGEPVGAPPLPPKTTSFKQWAAGLAQYVSSGRLLPEFDAWLAVGRAPTLRLPLDFAPFPGANSEESARCVSVALDAAETHALLHEVPAAYGTQINDVMMTALAHTFMRWAGLSTLLVDLEGHGREDLWDGLDLSRTVGWFTAIFPVLLKLERDVHPVEALRAIKEQLSYVPRRGIGYGLLRYLGDQNLAVKLRTLTQAEISFNYLGQFDNIFAEGAPFRLLQEPVGPLHSPRGQRFHLIEIAGQVAGGRLCMDWVYSQNLHQRATITALAEGFLATLRALIAARHPPEHAAGHIPADFPLVQLDQRTLEHLIGSGRTVEDIYPLAPGQQAMLEHALPDQAPGIYMLQWRCTLHGPLDAAAFRQAWRRVVERHAVLRTGFAWEGLAQPLQLVHRHAAPPWQQHDLRGLDPAEQQRRLDALLADDQAQAFDLARAPLLRLMLVQLADERHHFCWSYHHLLLDGWSVAPLLREVLTLYDRARGTAIDLVGLAYQRRQTTSLEPDLPPVRLFRDYIARLQHQDQAAAESFWRSYLGGAVPLRIGAHARPEQGYAEQQRRIPAATTAALRGLAQRSQITLNTLVQGAKALLLSRYSDREEVIFGVTVAGRPADMAGIETIVGPFINTLPLRIGVPPGDRLLPWLGHLQARQADLAQFDYTSLAQALAWAGLDTSAPLFETILRFQNYPLDNSLWQQAGLAIRDIAWFDRWHYPISFVVEPGTELTLGATYDRRHFSDRQIAQMLEHIQSLLELFTHDLDRTLGEVLYLTVGGWGSGDALRPAPNPTNRL